MINYQDKEKEGKKGNAVQLGRPICREKSPQNERWPRTDANMKTIE
jgi:hypothetical protein